MDPIQEPELTPDLIRDRYDRLLGRLRAAAEAGGSDPGRVRLVGITKGFGVDVALAASEAGLERLGENRVQEALPKVAAVPDVEWHLVGRLQSNKVRPAVGAFAVIHAVDSLDLIRRIDRVASEDGRRPRILFQVNVTREPSKGGFELDWFEAQTDVAGELVGELRQLHVALAVGLATIGPMGAGDEASRQAFARLRELRDRLQETSGVALPELSMGMTADAEAAAARGATLVRIGTALFGPRPE